MSDMTTNYVWSIYCFVVSCQGVDDISPTFLVQYFKLMFNKRKMSSNFSLPPQYEKRTGELLHNAFISAWRALRAVHTLHIKPAEHLTTCLFKEAASAGANPTETQEGGCWGGG